MKFFLFLILTFSSFLMAVATESRWCAVTDRAESIELSRISFLASHDGADCFSVVLTDGSAVDDVKNLKFEKVVYSAIMLPGDDLLFDVDGVGGVITLKGVLPRSVVSVMSPDGRCMLKSVAGDENVVVLDVSALSSGYYLLSAGGPAIKFYKK